MQSLSELCYNKSPIQNSLAIASMNAIAKNITAIAFFMV